MKRIRRQLKDLRALGFDNSRIADGGNSCTVACGACEAVVINGTPAHERGCPNHIKAQRADHDE